MSEIAEVQTGSDHSDLEQLIKQPELSQFFSKKKSDKNKSSTDLNPYPIRCKITKPKIEIQLFPRITDYYVGFNSLQESKSREHYSNKDQLKTIKSGNQAPNLSYLNSCKYRQQNRI